MLFIAGSKIQEKHRCIQTPSTVLTIMAHNKSFNVDCQNASFVLLVRCAASYLKR